MALSRIFGCGIAYPVRTKDGQIVSNPTNLNPRADSFSLYTNFVGDQILKGILPKSVNLKLSHKVPAQVNNKEDDEKKVLRHKSLNVREI